jgi:CubicO group peptidase (beta-lactamase class C family)
MHDAVKAYVDKGENVGAITLVDRRGETHVDVVGLADRERKIPLKRDTIFRIASMTKPVTAVATMILVEEGKVRLDEPVDRLLPELAKPRVLSRADGPLDDTVAANRPITVRDLLTFRMGYGLPMGPAQTPHQKAMAEAQIFGLKPPTPHKPDEWIKRLGALPLLHQPGERWMYHVGSDVLGVLIARASGMPLEQFLKERLFEPLGMKDTGFSVPASKTERLSSCYSVNLQTGALELIDDWKESQWSQPPAFPMGGGGLVSTADDYLAFARMLLSYGKLGNQRILSRPSVEAMTSDQITEENRRTAALMPGYFDARSWGFGVSMITRRTSNSTTPGSYGWGGAYGTTWNNDPEEEMISILMTQRGGMGPGPAGLGSDFPTLAYQAIDD